MLTQKNCIELSLFSEEELQQSQEGNEKEYDLTELFDRLAKSSFRSRFHLSQKDRDYISGKGLATIRHHAREFVAKRLAPAVIPNDGKQTPMRGHPVFITCYRLLLPQLFLQVAPHPVGLGTIQGGTGLCRSRVDGLD